MDSDSCNFLTVCSNVGDFVYPEEKIRNFRRRVGKNLLTARYRTAEDNEQSITETFLFRVPEAVTEVTL